MNKKESTGRESFERVDGHPRHESWIPITTHNSLVGFAIFLVYGALFVIVMQLHLSRSGLEAVAMVVGLLTAVIILWLLWKGTPQHRRGFLGNAGLTARVKANIITELGANNINVDSSKGVVTLDGTVRNANFREAAERLARECGADQVVNELNVAPSATGRTDSYVLGFPGVTASAGGPEVATRRSLEETVREALEDDPRVDARVMEVRVADGIAYLTGRQETTDASAAATEVAAHVPGILGASNDVEVMPSI